MIHRTCPSGPLALASIFTFFLLLLALSAGPAAAGVTVVQILDSAAAPSSTVLEYEPVRIRIQDTGLTSAQSIAVNVKSVLRGDSEWLQLPATAPGTFIGLLNAVPTLGPAPATPGDGIFEVTEAAGTPVLHDTVRVEFPGCTAATCPVAQASFLGSRVRLLDQNGSVLTRVNPPATITVQVQDFAAPPSSPIAVAITGSGAAGDSEILLLQPVAGQWRFSGTITLASGPGTPDNGSLEATLGSVLTASYPEPLGLAWATDTLIVSELLQIVDRLEQETSRVTIEGPVRVRVVAPLANLDPMAADSLGVALTSMAPDSETLVLTETGPDTGIFAGQLPSHYVTVPGTLDDGVLQARSGDILRATTATATKQANLVPGDVRFVDAGGNRVSVVQAGPFHLELEAYLAVPGAAGQVQVTVYNGSAEYVTVLMTEQSPGSGIFRGSGYALAGPPSIYNSYLEGAPGDTFLAYFGLLGTGSNDQAVFAVDPNDQPPVAVGDSFSILEDQPFHLDAMANDSDPEGGELTLLEWTYGSHGSVAQDPGDPRILVYTPYPNYFGADSFTYKIGDLGGHTATATVTVMITAVDDPPYAGPDTFSMDEDASIQFKVRSNDYDPDGGAVTLQTYDALSVNGGRITAGTLGNFELSYTPRANWSGSDSFTYTIASGGLTAVGTVTINVIPVADPPVAVADSATTLEETPVTIAVLANDRDDDGQTFRIYSISANGNNVVANADGTVTFTPALNFYGTKTFTYRIIDSGGSLSGSATVTVTITNVNDAPRPQNDTFNVSEDLNTTLAVAANDNDPDGNTLTVTAVTQGSHGTVTLISGTVRYLSHLNYNGPDSFTYTVADPAGLTATATVNVTVTAINDAPTSVGDSATTAEDTAVLIDVLANDSDPESALTQVSIYSNPAHGSVATEWLDGRWQVRYTPALNYSGTDSFYYRTFDPAGLYGSAALVSLTVTAVNDAPQVTNDAATTAEDTLVTIYVLANDYDVEGSTLTVTGAVLGGGATGTVVINPNKTLTYTPGANYFGGGFISYTVSDGSLSSTGTVTLTVTPVNDPPVVLSDAATTAEDQAVTIFPLANDSDDGGAPTLVMVYAVTSGSATFDGATGAVTFTPAADFYGTASFAYGIQDAQGLISHGSATITITAVNDPPTAQADAATVAEDGAVSVAVRANDSDVEGQLLTVTAAGEAAHGVVNFSFAYVTYIPAADYHGADSFTYTVSDPLGASATATVTITVTPVNDPPVAVADAATVNEDGAATIAVLGNDSDAEGDPLAVTAVTQGVHGSVALAGGVLTYTPAADYSGSDSFTYTLGDGAGGSATATVTITVAAVNDAPDAGADSYATAEDTPLTFAPLANDSDADGDALTIAAIDAVVGGAASATATTITFTPDADWNGAASVGYIVSDGHGGSVAVVAAIAVGAVNDPPVAAADAGAVAEDGSLTLPVLQNDGDVETPAGLAVIAVSAAAHGTVGFTAGAVIYTPAADYFGPDAFTYTIADPQGATASAAVAIVVSAVNDPPVAANDSATTVSGTAVVIAVLPNDSDLDGGALTVTAVGASAHGSAVRNGDDTITYTPAAGYSGNDSFGYTVGDGSATATATVTVLVQSAVRQASVLALRSVWIESGADVLSGDVVANTAGGAPYLGAAEVQLDGGVTVAAASDVKGNGVVLLSGATVYGDVVSNTLTNGGSILGTTTAPLALPVYATLPTLQTAASGTSDVNVVQNQTINLAPGVYRDLLVAKKGTVNFTGGTYVFRSVVIQREANLYFAAASTVKVEQKMSTATLTKIQPGPGSTATAATIVWHIAGINGTNGALASTPKPLEIATENVLQANFYVPNGTLWLQARVLATGSFIGKNVRIGPDVQVNLASAW